jgi:hypothetical protein
MFTGPEKIACKASWRDEFSARSPRMSFSTPTPVSNNRQLNGNASVIASLLFGIKEQVLIPPQWEQ